MLFTTDTRCSYANIVARKELHDNGVRSVEALADAKLAGRKAVVAATAIGSGTYVCGIFRARADGGPGRQDRRRPRGVGGGGASRTMLGGLKAGTFVLRSVKCYRTIFDWDCAIPCSGGHGAWTRT